MEAKQSSSTPWLNRRPPTPTSYSLLLYIVQSDHYPRRHDPTLLRLLLLSSHFCLIIFLHSSSFYFLLHRSDRKRFDRCATRSWHGSSPYPYLLLNTRMRSRGSVCTDEDNVRNKWRRPWSESRECRVTQQIFIFQQTPHISLLSAENSSLLRTCTHTHTRAGRNVYTHTHILCVPQPPKLHSPSTPMTLPWRPGLALPLGLETVT